LKRKAKHKKKPNKQTNNPWYIHTCIWKNLKEFFFVSDDDDGHKKLTFPWMMSQQSLGSP